MPYLDKSNVKSVFSWMAGIVLLMNMATQDDFWFILGFYTFGFLGLYGMTKANYDFKAILFLGVVVRLLIMGAFPNLSDDIYRFFWDGRLIWNGINPYSFLPSDLNILFLTGLDQSVFDSLNSPDYYTVYPPLAQFIYFMSSLADIDTSVMVIRLIIICADVLTVIGMTKILSHLKLNKAISLLYFLNPLVMVEGVGNLHFEGIMIAALIWGIIYFFINKSITKASLFFSIAIGVKLLPLMFLPFFLGSKNSVKFLSFLAIFLLVIFSPVFWSFDFLNLWTSIDLYFRNFEFNASIYYLLRAVGHYLSGYNLIAYIGPVLALITIGFNLSRASRIIDYNLKSFLDYGFLVFIIYLFLATTVHPWYLMLPLCLGVLSGYKWIVAWTFLVIFSYANYMGGSYCENLWVILLEYTVLGIIIWTEVQQKRLNF